MAETLVPTLQTADLELLARTLQERRTRSVDVVTSAKHIAASDTDGPRIELSGVAPQIEMDETGVTTTEISGAYQVSRTGNEGLSAKLEIPSAYLRRLHDEFPRLWVENINGWLGHGAPPPAGPVARTPLLLRLLTGQEGAPGVVRAVLSPNYRFIDDLDVLLAALEGMHAAGVQDPVITADLTERRMIVRVGVPAVSALAPGLLAGYRSPFGEEATPRRQALERAGWGAMLRSNPRVGDVVYAGFVLTNSEIGSGAFRLVPQITVLACLNGMTVTHDASREVHLGAKLDEGVVKMTPELMKANIDVVKARTAAAVQTFLDPEYVQAKVREMERVAGKEIDDPPAVIEKLGRSLGYSKDEQAGILSMFTKGGQTTAGGIMQAVTAHAQTVADRDRAWELESSGVDALHAASALVR